MTETEGFAEWCLEVSLELFWLPSWKGQWAFWADFLSNHFIISPIYQLTFTRRNNPYFTNRTFTCHHIYWNPSNNRKESHICESFRGFLFLFSDPYCQSVCVWTCLWQYLTCPWLCSQASVRCSASSSSLWLAQPVMTVTAVMAAGARLSGCCLWEYFWRSSLFLMPTSWLLGLPGGDQQSRYPQLWFRRKFRGAWGRPIVLDRVLVNVAAL